MSRLFRSGFLLVLFFMAGFASIVYAGEDVGVPAGGGGEERAREDVDFTADFFDEEGEFEDEYAELVVRDPIEPFNRGMFWVNDKLYFYLFKPAARVVRVLPEPARVSVSNFFSNLSTPIRLANSLLQLKCHDAGMEAGRFILNSLLGIGGLFDVAESQGGPGPKDEDFGQTLGYYGMGQGFYIVWPLFGPSSLRDTVGRVADAFVDPVPYLVTDYVGYVAVKTGDRVNSLSLDKETYEAIKADALDPYLFVRSAYYQNREGKVRQ